MQVWYIVEKGKRRAMVRQPWLSDRSSRGRRVEARRMKENEGLLERSAVESGII